VFLLVQAFPVVGLVGQVDVGAPANVSDLLFHFPTDCLANLIPNLEAVELAQAHWTPGLGAELDVGQNFAEHKNFLADRIFWVLKAVVDQCLVNVCRFGVPNQSPLDFFEVI
jgi:hypothetical protein